jgi:hypothetical protein
MFGGTILLQWFALAELHDLLRGAGDRTCGKNKYPVSSIGTDMCMRMSYGWDNRDPGRVAIGLSTTPVGQPTPASPPPAPASATAINQSVSRG